MKTFLRFTALFLCLVMIFAFLPPASARAVEKVVRVGWYESDFNRMDQYGRRSGYAYEYQQKLAAYTGWRYEYVEGSWSELFQMLLDGEIDLMSDISYTEERAEKLLYSALPMGAEDYFACVSTQRRSGITAENLSSFNGKRIGVNKDSYQELLLREWLEKNHIQAELVLLTTGEWESVAMLDRGELDAFVDVDVYGYLRTTIPLVQIGSSDYYFAVSLNRPELLPELNSAMARIQEENHYYNLHLQEKYFGTSSVNQYYTADELDWLDAHGTVRVGYRDNFLPFCARDEESGELTGALRDYLSMISACMLNATIDFEAVAYPTTEAALAALRAGEIDCVFPVNLTDYDAEEFGVLATEADIETEIYAAVRSMEHQRFSLTGLETVALPEGDINFKTFLLDKFQNWDYIEKENQLACFQAVARGEADCVLFSNYRGNLFADVINEFRFSTVTTGQSMTFSFAVGHEAERLYGMLNKASVYIPDSAINAALASYSFVERDYGFEDFLREYSIPVFATAVLVLAVILLLLVHSQRSGRRAKRALQELKESLAREKTQERELAATRQKAYTDPLTHVKSKHAWQEATDAVQDSIDCGEQKPFAVVVFDVNGLKQVNDEQGHEAGDAYILAAARMICRTFQHSPVYRIGGDEFTALLTGEDYENRLALLDAFNRQVEQNRREGQVTVAAGLAKHGLERGELFSDVFRRADKRMYERKLALKSGR